MSYNTEQHALLMLRISYIFPLGHCISTQYTKFSVDYYQPFLTNMHSSINASGSLDWNVQGDTKKKRELLKNPTKIEEIQEKKFIDRN